MHREDRLPEAVAELHRDDTGFVKSNQSADPGRMRLSAIARDEPAAGCPGTGPSPNEDRRAVPENAQVISLRRLVARLWQPRRTARVKTLDAAKSLVGPGKP